MSICSGPACVVSRAGATAAALLPLVACAVAAGAGGAGTCGSGSRISAPSPLPSAFLVIGNDLLGELRIALSPFAMNIVKDDWFPETWRFGKPHIARNHALKYLRPKETSQIRGHLPGQGRSLVVHREQNAFDFETWIQRASDPHKSIQQF